MSEIPTPIKLTKRLGKLNIVGYEPTCWDLVKYYYPAEYVIHCFGGVRATARAIGRDKSSVSVWRNPKHKKGTGGQVPHKIQPVILKIAGEMGLDITPSDLILGRMHDVG